MRPNKKKEELINHKKIPDYHWDFSICVTKECSLNELSPIIKQFEEQRVTFAIVKRNEGYEIWREPLDMYDQRYLRLRAPSWNRYVRMWDQGIEVTELMLQKKNGEAKTVYRRGGKS